MRNFLCVIALGATIFAGGMCYASEVPPIWTWMQNAGAKEGMMYNVKDGRVLNTLSLEVADYAGVALNVAYVGSDGLGAIIDYDLSKIPKVNLPVLNLVQYLHVGIGAAYKTITLASDTAEGDNRFVWGPQVSFKLKF